MNQLEDEHNDAIEKEQEDKVEQNKKREKLARFHDFNTYWNPAVHSTYTSLQSWSHFDFSADMELEAGRALLSLTSDAVYSVIYCREKYIVLCCPEPSWRIIKRTVVILLNYINLSRKERYWWYHYMPKKGGFIKHQVNTDNQGPPFWSHNSSIMIS